MRRCAVPLIVTIVMLACLPAIAGKVGFINAEIAVAQVAEGKVKLAELQAWQTPRQVRLDELRDQVVALREQLNSSQGKVSAEALSEIEKNELAARRAFEDARRVYERDLQEKKDRFLAEIAVKIGTVGKEYAKANDYDAVFLTTAQPLVYVAESADLTAIVVKLYDERFPVSAAAKTGS